MNLRAQGTRAARNMITERMTKKVTRNILKGRSPKPKANGMTTVPITEANQEGLKF